MVLADAFWCGGAAGAVGSLVTQPLDTIRIKMQTMVLGAGRAPAVAVRTAALPPCIAETLACLCTIVRNEGAHGLYRGVVSPVAAAGPRSACIFAGYDLALRLRGGSGLADHALAGVAGGAVAAPLTNAAELVKCRAQVAASGSKSVARAEMQICLSLFKHEGIRGLTCGLPLTLARDACFRGLYFLTYEGTARALSGGRAGPAGGGGARPFHASLIAGGLAGVAAWLPVYPLDVLKTHWQTGRRFGATTVEGLLRRGLESEGPQWLLRGLAPTLLRTWPLNAIVCAMYETLQALRRPL